jgi:hypothetical protein
MEETIENKYCFECDKRVGKKEKGLIEEKGKWIYYTETYNILYQSFDGVSIYICLDCEPNPEVWECKICNKEYNFTTEFCDENRFRKCSECIIKDLFILRCECNVCREIVEANLIIPK